MWKSRNSNKLYLPHKGYHLLPLNHQLNGVRKLHDGYGLVVQWNTDNVQFIYICEERRDDPIIALIVFLSLSKGTCVDLFTQPYTMRRKDNRNKYKKHNGRNGQKLTNPECAYRQGAKQRGTRRRTVTSQIINMFTATFHLLLLFVFVFCNKIKIKLCWESWVHSFTHNFCIEVTIWRNK